MMDDQTRTDVCALITALEWLAVLLADEYGHGEDWIASTVAWAVDGCGDTDELDSEAIAAYIRLKAACRESEDAPA